MFKCVGIYVLAVSKKTIRYFIASLTMLRVMVGLAWNDFKRTYQTILFYILLKMSIIFNCLLLSFLRSNFFWCRPGQPKKFFLYLQIIGKQNKENFSSFKWKDATEQNNSQPSILHVIWANMHSQPNIYFHHRKIAQDDKILDV